MCTLSQHGRGAHKGCLTAPGQQQCRVSRFVYSGFLCKNVTVVVVGLYWFFGLPSKTGKNMTGRYTVAGGAFWLQIPK